MATTASDLHARACSTAAARTVDAVKTYRKGQTEIRALDGVSVDFATGRFNAIEFPGDEHLLEPVPDQVNSVTPAPNSARAPRTNNGRST